MDIAQCQTWANLTPRSQAIVAENWGKRLSIRELRDFLTNEIPEYACPATSVISGWIRGGARGTLRLPAKKGDNKQYSILLADYFFHLDDKASILQAGYEQIPGIIQKLERHERTLKRLAIRVGLDLGEE